MLFTSRSAYSLVVAMMILRTTYTLTVDIEPAGLDDDEAEKERAADLVAGDVASFIEDDNVTVTVEWVDVS